MANELSSSSIPPVGFPPLPVSPDKIGRYHYDIDDHTYRKKTNRLIILFELLNCCGLLCIGGKRTAGRTRIRWIHAKASSVWGLLTTGLTASFI
jgi:hypothetical protein